jgi:hypothetical protein
MKLKLYVLCLAMGLQLVIHAQSKLSFENHNQLGLLSGASATSWQLQTVNGVNYNTFFLGAGIGIDKYYFKTVPLFAEGRKYIFNKKETPFLYVDAGTNFPSEKEESLTWKITTYQPGFYYDAGIGYQWMIVKRFHVDASFGYSQKKYSSKVHYPVPAGTETLAPESFQYRLQRFTMKLGLGF